MSKEVIIPALGESITSGILSSWKVDEGSYVELDQPIYELETDKITQEGLADASGVIKFLAQEGDEVEIGATIATIDESADAPSSSAVAEEIEEAPAPVSMPKTQPESNAPVLDEVKSAPAPATEPDNTSKDPGYSPAVRKLLNETGIDPSTIEGTGKDGRITKGDVLKAQKPPAQKPAPVAPTIQAYSGSTCDLFSGRSGDPSSTYSNSPKNCFPLGRSPADCSDSFDL
jgi:2-oxoglutarate dehydrogenase E2 component (dihydrolipoamide succinyltransferase)